jgi:hypothetical protein
LGSDEKFFQRENPPVGSEGWREVPNIGAIEALESYSAEHPESIQELQNWYWKKFETLYKAFIKRKAVEDASKVRNAMIAGLWGNSNFDDDKNTRQKALTDIEESFQRAVNYIYNETTEDDEHKEMMKDPFFAAINNSDEVTTEAPIS